MTYYPQYCIVAAVGVEMLLIVLGKSLERIKEMRAYVIKKWKRGYSCNDIFLGSRTPPLNNAILYPTKKDAKNDCCFENDDILPVEIKLIKKK